jgi:hypothetical protein
MKTNKKQQAQKKNVSTCGWVEKKTLGMVKERWKT